MARPAVWVGIVPVGKPFRWQVRNGEARRAGEGAGLKGTGSFADGKKSSLDGRELSRVQNGQNNGPPPRGGPHRSARLTIMLRHDKLTP